MKQRLLTYFIAFVLGTAAAMLLSSLRHKGEEGKVIVQTDTIIVHDTARIIEPKVVKSTVTKYVKVPVLDTVMVHDSAFIELPYETKVYEDTLFCAVVSGYDATLDSLSIYCPTKYITTTRTETKPAPRWSFGLQAGIGFNYGLVGQKGLNFGPYVGIGATYRILPK